jgi:long-chain acyl-CoA synthetase
LEKKVFTFPELGPYKWWTYREVEERVNNLANGLVSVGVIPKVSRFAIYMDTAPEWMITAHACFTHSVTVVTGSYFIDWN